ncbi:MAG: hypothetical protein KDA96_01550 [Planctomycetaceae bacterium]|nr:hypothetical protein [Planctomycetaceae bacterium]
MADSADDLNTQLTRAFQKRDSAKEKKEAPVQVRGELVPQEPEAEQAEEFARDKMGMISRLRLKNAESAHELEKARTTYMTEMQLLRHRADAAIRESRAFWDAKSVEVAESIKTYVQSTIRALEIDRLDSRNADLQRAYESASSALEKAQASSLPEVMKDRLIQDILRNFETTLERIQNDTIVTRYDLN